MKIDLMRRLLRVKEVFRRWWFPLLLVFGFLVFVIVRYQEDQPYSGATQSVVGNVTKVTYVSGGTMTGRSFVRVELDNESTYRMPLDQQNLLNVGDKVRFVVAVEDAAKSNREIRVMSYEIIAPRILDNLYR